jgi:hypothetical protein
MKQKFTKGNKSYWDENGVYQKEYDELYKLHVPSSGAAATVHGELIRGASRLFYEYCNNGNCNAVEVEQEDCDGCGGSGWEETTCHDCGGSGEYDYGDGEETCEECGGSGEVEEDCSWCYGDCTEDGDAFITEYYEKFIDLIDREVGGEATRDMVKWMTTRIYNELTFKGEELTAYNKMVDMIVFHVLTTEDKELPSWYPEKPE